MKMKKIHELLNFELGNLKKKKKKSELKINIDFLARQWRGRRSDDGERRPAGAAARRTGDAIHRSHHLQRSEDQRTGKKFPNLQYKINLILLLFSKNSLILFYICLFLQ